MLEKRKFCNDECKSFGVLPADLSKAFDCLSGAFNSNATGIRFGNISLKWIHIDLTGRKITKIH